MALSCLSVSYNTVLFLFKLVDLSAAFMETVKPDKGVITRSKIRGDTFDQGFGTYGQYDNPSAVRSPEKLAGLSSALVSGSVRFTVSVSFL